MDRIEAAVAEAEKRGAGLHPFQVVGARFLASRYHALLGTEMGLGKTRQALIAARAVGYSTGLWICPASVRTSVRREIDAVLGPGHNARWTVCSYNGAGKLALEAERRGITWDVCVIDEAHFLKTPDSQRTQAVFGNGKDGKPRGLARRATYIWTMSGTPVLNRPAEFFPLLKTLASGTVLAPYTSWAAYSRRYCGAFFDGRGMDTRGATHTEELGTKLRGSGFMLRHTKKEVAPELGEIIESLVPLCISDEEKRKIAEVEETITNREAYLSPVMEDYSALGDLARLQRATGEAKAPAVADWVVENLFEGGDVKKVVVFFWHRSVGETLVQRFAAAGLSPVTYHGDMNDKEKEAAVRTFATPGNGCRVFVGQIAACGTGINGLQEVSSHAVFAERVWTPGVADQAIGRLHRFGKKEGVPVNVYGLIVPGTLEEAMVAVEERKNRVIDSIMRGGGVLS